MLPEVGAGGTGAYYEYNANSQAPADLPFHGKFTSFATARGSTPVKLYVFGAGWQPRYDIWTNRETLTHVATGDQADTIHVGPTDTGDGRVDSNDGDDTIDVRNGTRDTVYCGSGNDTVAVDPGDQLWDCENVTR